MADVEIKMPFHRRKEFRLGNSGLWKKGIVLAFFSVLLFSCGGTGSPSTSASTAPGISSTAPSSATNTALPPSVINSVSPAPATSAKLTWTAPATNTDGTPLTDLAGYNVYYGASAGNYTTKINVGNVTTVTVSNLAAGTYYFAVTAYSSAGQESGYSNVGSKTIL